MTNRPNGLLYVGCTTDLARRVGEHREGVADGFAEPYGLKRLVYSEWHPDILAAKQREMTIKHCRKMRLILKENLNWGGLYDTLA